MRLSRFHPINSAPSSGLYEDMVPIITENLKGFVSKREDGALIGPLALMLYFPHLGSRLGLH